MLCGSLSAVVVPLPFLTTWIVPAESPVRLISVLPAISVQVVPLSRLYFIPAAAPESVPVSVPVAVKVAVGVVSLLFAVGAVSVISAFAVGVPETVICVKLLRVTDISLTAATL